MRVWVACVVVAAAGGAEARGTCAVEGKKVPAFVVEVAAKEATPFKLRVEGLPVKIDTGGTEQAAVAHVKGALAFDARVDAKEIPARTKKSTAALNGMVHLATATALASLHADTRARYADAEVNLPGGVLLRNLVVPCDALTLDEIEAPKASLEREPPAGGFVAKGNLLHFRNEAGKGEVMEVAVERASAMVLRRIVEEDAWVRVTSSWADGTTVTGWVQKSELSPSGSVAHESVLEGMLGSAQCKSLPETGPNDKVITTEVKAGTQVFAARYLGPWAKVIEGQKLDVRFRPKDDWVEILKVPGLASVSSCDGNTTLVVDAWIPRAAVKLPAP